MSRLIDADELLKHKYHDSNRYENAVACYYICNAPTVDAVEVVRCKECVFGELDNRAEMYRCRSVSFPQWNKGEHFCSYGVKETDNE